jgi:hypothetical protein
MIKITPKSKCKQEKTKQIQATRETRPPHIDHTPRNLAVFFKSLASNG